MRIKIGDTTYNSSNWEEFCNKVKFRTKDQIDEYLNHEEWEISKTKEENILELLEKARNWTRNNSPEADMAIIQAIELLIGGRYE